MTKDVLQQCLVSTEPPIVLTARKKIYEWLVGKLRLKPDWRVLQGVSLGKENITRNIDCLVQTPNGGFAYFVIDKNFNVGDFTAIADMAYRNQWTLNAIFTKDWLRCSENNRRHLHLSETEKKLISQGMYDLTVSHSEKVLGSLVYFDSDADSIFFLRRIRESRPTKHFCDVVECRLEDMLMLPKTGELVAKGEYESFKKRKTRKEQFEKKVAKREEAKRKAAKEIRKSDDLWINIVTGKEIRSSEPVKNDEQRWGTCEICGEYTNRWWSFNDEDLTCKCKKCSGGGRGEEA